MATNILPNTLYQVIYNDIQLDLTHIDRFDQEAEYSDDGVDRMYNHITVTVRGIVNAEIAGQLGDKAAYITALRRNMLEPRKTLRVLVAGQVLYSTAPGLDAKNGPQPKYVKIIAITGQTIMVEFSVESWEACAFSQIKILTNRWSQKTDIDQNAYTTITSNGTIITRTDGGPQNIGINPDQFRDLPLPVAKGITGFNRIHQSFEVSSDGTRLDWTIVDQEYFRPAPYLTQFGDQGQITSWNGSWREESTDKQGVGALVVGTIVVSATGGKTTSAAAIISFVTTVASSRLRQGDIVKYYSIEEGLSENTITLTIGVWSATTQNDGKIKVGTRIGTTVLPYNDPNLGSAFIKERGTAEIEIVTAFLFATCDQHYTDPEKPDTADITPTPNPYYAQPTVIVNSFTPPDTNQISAAQVQNPYTLYQLETQVLEDNCVIQLPVASSYANPPAFFAQTAQPLSKKSIRFRLERLNALPILPDNVLSGHTLLKSTVNMCEPEILPSGEDRIYIVYGEYIFGMNNTANVGTATLILPTTPIDASGFTSNNDLTSAYFNPNLIG